MSSTSLFALLRREVSRFMRVWVQTIIPPIVTSTLFILIFGYSLGSRISSVSGVSYLEFIIPGLLMMGVIMSSYSNSNSSLYIAKHQGNVQELLVAPLSYWEIIVAFVIASTLRALIVGSGILAISMLFADVVIDNIFLVLFFVISVSVLFSLAGIATAIWATSFDKMNVFTTFLITPLTYLGGVFYSISMLPGVWQNVAKFNPILYMIDGFRYGFIGTSDIPILTSMGLLLFLILIFFLICFQMFRTGYKLRT